jgi:hypothetical protein
MLVTAYMMPNDTTRAWPNLVELAYVASRQQWYYKSVIIR